MNRLQWIACALYQVEDIKSHEGYRCREVGLWTEVRICQGCARGIARVLTCQISVQGVRLVYQGAGLVGPHQNLQQWISSRLLLAQTKRGPVPVVAHVC